jgi:hypothetical protein
MFKGMRSTWLAGGGALLLVLSISGFVAAATIAKVGEDPTVDPVTTTQGFVDVNGDGIDDTCQPAVLADPVAAAAAASAADLNGDGQISVSEAAQTAWIGGINCNHGGYVSGVAHACGDVVPVVPVAPVVPVVPVSAPLTAVTTSTVVCTEDEAVDETADTTTPTVCVPPVTPVAPASPVDATLAVAPVVITSPNDHGKKVSAVAHSTATGGKNCNHGGAVSEAAHKDHAARDAAKAAKAAARDAAKAARNAARDASRLNKVHGKGHKG